MRQFLRSHRASVCTASVATNLLMPGAVPSGMKPLELVGQSIDKYEVLEEVGHGGMAVVFRGIDRDLSREVAIKVLHAHLADRGESKQRLHREAITVARLRHPNIVEIYDYANPDSGLSYIVTEFIHGQTLRHWLEDGWQPRPLLAALIVYRLCEALEHAHDLGIVHRDIKPENVMIRSDGWIKLMDFGIAQLVDHQKLTMTGQLLGSPAYMAPELISGKPIDARTDIFALGILLYQLATGQLPFNGRNPHEVLSRIASTEYSPPSAINPRVDEHLEQIIAKALAREPQDRFQSSKAFALELTRYVEEMGLTSDGEELERFFVDPTTVLPQLDQKICDTLVERGKLAADAGQSARALRLLSRVLDFEPQHPIALNLVTQVQERGRRLRQVTLIAAAAGLVGVVAAAYLLMSHPTPQDSPDLVAQANADRTPALAPTPAVLEISTSQDSEPTSADSAVTAGSSTATSLATDGAQQAVSPRETDARSDSARPSKPQQTGNNEPPQVKKPDRADVDDAPEQARCQLRIEGIPVPSRSSYVVAGAGPTALPVPALPSQALELAFATPSVTLQLASANPGTASGFESVLRVEASDCSGAQAPLVLRASIKPARLHFVATNFPLENLVVRCLEGCGQGTGKLRLARDFSALELPPGILEQGVAFEFKADGYRTVSREYRLHPGDNELRIELQEVE